MLSFSSVFQKKRLTFWKKSDKIMKDKLLKHSDIWVGVLAAICLYAILQIKFDEELFLNRLENLMMAAYSNKKNIRDLVADMVSTYHSEGKHPNEGKNETYEQLVKTIHE